MYAVIGDPPFLAGGVQWTVASALSAVAVPIVGAPGAVADDVVVVRRAFAQSIRSQFVPSPAPLAVSDSELLPVVVPLVPSSPWPWRPPSCRP